MRPASPAPVPREISVTTAVGSSIPRPLRSPKARASARADADAPPVPGPAPSPAAPGTSEPGPLSPTGHTPASVIGSLKALMSDIASEKHPPETQRGVDGRMARGSFGGGRGLAAVLGLASGALGLTGLGGPVTHRADTLTQAAPPGRSAGRSAGRRPEAASAGETLSPEEASPSLRAISVITAEGTAAAATHIPIVSQEGPGRPGTSVLIAALGFTGR